MGRICTGQKAAVSSCSGPASEKGHTEALAYSDNGDITGTWTQDDRLLFEKDGGYGMIFESNSGELYFDPAYAE